MNTEYKINTKQPILCYDIVFKTIFTNHLNLLARLISDITDISLLKKNMSLEDISDVTSKTAEEIKEISKNN